MIKGILFDMDGVLIDAREWHYEALNKALEPFGFNISRKLHLTKLNGLPTKIKLQYLTDNHGLPISIHSLIFNLKQDWTSRLANYYCRPVVEHIWLINKLKEKNMKIGVVTNSISSTTNEMLKLAKLYDYFDVIVTNEDVANSKPSPDPYLFALKKLKLLGSEVLVIEDSKHGVASAEAASCKVLVIESPKELKYSLVGSMIEK